MDLYLLIGASQLIASHHPFLPASTNAFLCKLENLKATVALFFWNWNFCWSPRTLRRMLAMQAGLIERVLTLRQLCV